MNKRYHVDQTIETFGMMSEFRAVLPAVTLNAVPQTGSAKWLLEWRAPQTPGVVSFDLSANAANGDASEFGDFIYQSSKTISPVN
ncbi:hypothetical protein BH23GEM8_BH23GEM8_23630 [soil metagenome]